MTIKTDWKEKCVVLSNIQCTSYTRYALRIHCTMICLKHGEQMLLRIGYTWKTRKKVIVIVGWISWKIFALACANVCVRMRVCVSILFECKICVWRWWLHKERTFLLVLNVILIHRMPNSWFKLKKWWLQKTCGEFDCFSLSFHTWNYPVSFQK